MTRTARIVAVSLTVILALAVVTLGQRQPAERGGGGNRIGEAPDAALRRAQLMHDMYAAPTDRAALTDRVAQARTSRGAGGKAPRALPINYGSFDPGFRLRPLVRESQIRPGASLSRIRPQQPGRGAAAAAATWENLGPTNVAGRVSALALDPVDPKTIYRGTGGGGVWKSTNAGKDWDVLTDSIGNLSIGAIAVAPSARLTVYVGTGEGTMGIDGIDGIGLIKSTDGGGTWSLPVTVPGRRFFDLNVHPTNADQVLAATLNGIQKSNDGGQTWNTTLRGLTATQIVRVPAAPTHLLAAVWDIASSNPTWNGFLYRSVDGGDTWARIANQPFDADAGRISLAIAKNSPTVYALVATASGNSQNCNTDSVDQIGVFRSTNEGVTWTLQSNPFTGTCPTSQFDAGYDSILGSQGWYATAITVDPSNTDTVYAGGLDVWKSTDAAKHWTKLSRWDLDPSNAKYVHADIHALVWAAGTLLVGDDGGVNATSNGGTSFSGMNTGVVTRQYYSIGFSPADTTVVFGGAQDNGTNIRIGSTTNYKEVIGGDGFGVAAHPADAKTLYGTVYRSRVFRTKNGGTTFPEVTGTYGANETLPFISPLTMDPNNAQTLYTGSNFLYKTTDGGSTWAKVSTTDLGDGSTRGFLTSIAVSRTDSKKLLTATGSGTIKKSDDSGAHWTQVTNGLPSGWASHVEFDPNNPSVFYVSFMNAGPVARLLKTTNGGTSFVRIDNGLPAFPVHTVRVDPTNSHALYVGLDIGLYKSLDDGATWAAAGAGLPAVSVWDIVFSNDASIIRVASHGRGFWQLLKPPSPPTPTPDR